MSDGFAALNQNLVAIGDALGAVMQMTGPEPTYIPLDEFLTKQIMDSEGDFDMSDLVLEDEF